VKLHRTQIVPVLPSSTPMRVATAVMVAVFIAPSFAALAVPANAPSAAVKPPVAVTAVVAILTHQLDERGRTAVSNDLNRALAGHEMRTLPVLLRLRIASLMLSLGGVAAASPWARSALSEVVDPSTGRVQPGAGVLAAEVWRAIAVGHVITGQRERAAPTLRHCERRHGAAACRPSQVARTLAQMAWFEDAEALMKRALEEGGADDINFVLDAAQISDAAGHHDRQLELLQAALDKHGPDSRLLDATLQAYRRNGRHEDAMAWLDALYKAAPQTPGILARYHHAYAGLEGAATHRNGPYERYIKARSALLQRAKDKRDATALYVAAQVALIDARYDEAMQHLAPLDKLAPADARPFAIRAMISLWRDDRQRAEVQIGKAELADPNDNIVPYVRSLIARDRRDLPMAIKHLERYLQMRRDRSTTRFHRHKVRVLGDLHMMRRGELPEPLDRPDHPSRRYHLYSLFEPFELPGPPVFIGAIAALFLGALGGAWWSTKHKE
jgi:tetratricopeptide (TPR) repeat protein